MVVPHALDLLALVIRMPVGIQAAALDAGDVAFQALLPFGT